MRPVSSSADNAYPTRLTTALTYGLTTRRERFGVRLSQYPEGAGI
jgi:hypothetical protein